MRIIITLLLLFKYIFLSTITFHFLFHFRVWRCLLLFNGALFPQKAPSELILLSMDYDVALRLGNVESQKSKVISLKNFEEVYQNLRSPAPQPQPPYFFTLNKDSGVKIRPGLKKSYLFHELEDMKSWYCVKNYNLRK